MAPPFTSTHLYGGEEPAPKPQPTPEPQSKWAGRFWADLAERVGSTFLQTLLPAAVAAGNLAGLDWLNALELSGSAAGIALIKGLLANLADAESGASLLPAPPGPEVNPDADEDGGYPDQPQDDGFGGH